MTENLLHQLEQLGEKMLTLLSEVESSRKEIQRLNSENTVLKAEMEKNIYDNQKNAEKVREMLLLVESVSGTDTTTNISSLAAVKPALVQG